MAHAITVLTLMMNSNSINSVVGRVTLRLSKSPSVSRQVVTSFVESLPYNTRGTGGSFPVIGRLSMWSGAFVDSKFKMFNTGNIDGLAWVNGSAIEFLAVASRLSGKGYFRKFIEDLKQHYTVIRLWAIMNPDLEVILTRYGFVSGFDVDEYGEIVDVMDWNRNAST